MWTALAALISGLLSAGGVLFGVWITQTAAAKRDVQAALDRRADRVEAVRGRLHRDRIDAYRDFVSACEAYSVAQDRVAASWAARNRAGAALDDTQDSITRFDTANAAFLADADASQQANVRLLDALAMLELVASHPVASCAGEITVRVRAAAAALMQTGDRPTDGIPLDMWAVVEAARGAVPPARDALIDAIRKELQADS